MISKIFTFDLKIIIKCLVINFLLAGYHLLGNEPIKYIAILLLFVFIITESNDEDFYLLLSLGCLYKLVKLSDYGLFFVFQLLCIAKMLIRNKNGLAISGVAALLILTCIEVALDYTSVTIGAFIVTLSNILYAIIIFITKFGKRIRPLLIAKVLFYVSLFLLVYISINSSANGMSLSDYANSELSYQRFGTETLDILGAMSIPTYAGFILSAAYFLFTKSNPSLVKKIMYIGGSIFAVIIGALSVSRTFILVLIVFVISVLVSLLFEAKSDKKHVVNYIIVAFCVSLAGFFLFRSQISNATSKMLERLSSNYNIESNGRVEIWVDCFNYLKDNPLRLVFGSGNKNYINIGAEQGFLFSMSSHSLFIDAIMAWGLFGTIAFVSSYFSWFISIKQHSKNSFTSFIPLIVLLSTFALGGSFVYFDSFIYLIGTSFIAAKSIKENNLSTF